MVRRDVSISAADFEKFQMPRLKLATMMEADLKKVILYWWKTVGHFRYNET